MKKIVFAPDSFKGSISAERVCEIYKDAVSCYFSGLETISLPVSDGGEGLVNSMLQSLGGRKITLKVQDPLWREIEADYAILKDGTAVIEMAAASGLALLSKTERDPLETTTYGTGQLIRDALLRCSKRIILGLGGSSSNDGGAGAAAALGIFYKSSDGKEIELCGRGLTKLNNIDYSNMPQELLDAEIIVACDVNNPLYGKNGAAYIYGPQKGAASSGIELLDNNLRHLAMIISKQTGIDVQELPGLGAAGGTALPFMVFANAKLCRGIDIILDMIGFEDVLSGCDLVVTGEGCTDYQSVMGKVISGVSSRAVLHGVPVIVISGSLGDGFDSMYDCGVQAMFSACRYAAASIDEVLSQAEENLLKVSKDVFGLIKLSEQLL